MLRTRCQELNGITRAMLILMAGLPAAGKSAISAELSRRTGAVLLCKDTVRAALFPADRVDYSREQGDLCMEAIYRVAEYLFLRDPSEEVIIDGRTYTKRAQVDAASRLADGLGVTLVVLRCLVSDETARERLERQSKEGFHPASNRDFRLYRELKKKMEPLDRPHLEIWTDRLTLDQCVEHSLRYLNEVRSGAP